MDLVYDVIHWRLDGTELVPLSAPLPINYPSEADVRLGTVYGYSDQYTGLYSGGGAPSGPAPESISLAAGDESITVTLEPASGSEAIRMYVRFFLAPGGSFSTESLAFSRIGAGDVTLTGLANGTVYGVIAYHKVGDAIGYPTVPDYAMPSASIGSGSTIFEVADAVRTELTSITFAGTITWDRAWLPRREITEFSAGEVYGTVCPRSSENVVLTRSTVQREYRIDVALQLRFSGSDEDASIDPLIRTTDAVAKALRGVALVGSPDARWTRETREPIFSEETADQFAVFTSVISVFYKVEE